MSKITLIVVFFMILSTLSLGQSKTTLEKTSGRDIVELLDEGKIEIKSLRCGIDVINVSLRRLVPSPVKVRIPIGTFFGIVNSSSKNMVTLISSNVQLSDDDWKMISISAADANLTRELQKNYDSLIVELSPYQEALRKLMAAVSTTGVDLATRQAAVWILIDDADYSDLGRLVSSYNFSFDKGKRVIHETEAAHAIKLCNDIGIDVTSKRIWHSRQSIYEHLENGTLKKWMEMMIAKTTAKEHAISIKLQASIEWVSIPAGTFLMGSSTNEKDRRSDENQHEVTLSAFKMSKYEVTYELYNLYCVAIDEPYCGTRLPLDQVKHPVTSVTWNEASAFAKWMDCRLPTEAEWEYACRAGTITPFNTGNTLDTSQANYNRKYFLDSDQIRETMPVGSFSPNAWGLYDMHGNVREWCSDWWSEYPTTTQIDPKGPTIGYSRIYRGGCYFDKDKDCRSAKREGTEENTTSWAIGFRLVSLK
jgi:formylglycine-generating enzyme